MEKLPGEVLSNIFIRLLAKQLAQMRCICKPWNALLSDSSFIKSHLKHSKHNNDEILLHFSRPFSFGRNPFTTHPSHSPDLELTKFIKLPDNPQSETSGEVIGSMNGLICFSYRSYSLSSRYYAIYIWNPSLSVMLTLPSCAIPLDDYSVKNHLRFGFDPKTDDYKVVKFIGPLQTRDMVPQVEVYSMRKGSWDVIDQRLPSHITRIRRQNRVCVDGPDGHLHWLCATDYEWKQPTIVAFDLGEEAFHEIPVPEATRDSCIILGVLAGKLCVMSCVRDGECGVWVMDEYGVVESWVKHHAFPQFGGGILPYGFTLRNEFLFQVGGEDFALYDPIAAKLKTFKTMPSLYGISKVVEYVDSLVWVAPREHERTGCSISQFQF